MAFLTAVDPYYDPTGGYGKQGKLGNYGDAGVVPSGPNNATGGAAGVISHPSAQQLGTEYPHDPVWQQRGPHPTVDQHGGQHILEMLERIVDNSVDHTHPFHQNENWGQSHKLWEIFNWAIKNLRPNKSPAGVDATYWGAAYRGGQDGSVMDMLDGPKMYTPRGEPDTSPDAIFHAPDLAVNPRDISLDPHSVVWTYDNTYAGWNDRLLFDPSPVDPYGPNFPGLFDNQFQPSR